MLEGEKSEHLILGSGKPGAKPRFVTKDGELFLVGGATPEQVAEMKAERRERAGEADAGEEALVGVAARGGGKRSGFADHARSKGWRVW